MHSNGHVRFGGRAGETGREQFRYCAPARPYFNVRRYPNRKLLIKPSQAAIRRVRERLASELRTLLMRASAHFVLRPVRVTRTACEIRVLLRNDISQCAAQDFR